MHYNHTGEPFDANVLVDENITVHITPARSSWWTTQLRIFLLFQPVTEHTKSPAALPLTRNEASQFIGFANIREMNLVVLILTLPQKGQGIESVISSQT